MRKINKLFMCCAIAASLNLGVSTAVTAQDLNPTAPTDAVGTGNLGASPSRPTVKVGPTDQVLQLSNPTLTNTPDTSGTPPPLTEDANGADLVLLNQNCQNNQIPIAVTAPSYGTLAITGDGVTETTAIVGTGTTNLNITAPGCKVGSLRLVFSK